MTRKLRATDTGDRVEAALVNWGATSLKAGSEATGNSFLACTWLVASSSVSGAASENADEFGLMLIRFGHEANLLVPEADCGAGVEVGC